MPNKYKSSATIIPLEEAVGKVLAHDITEIRPGQFKGAAFRKGYIIREEDLPHLRRLGKEHLFVLDIAKNEIHEDEAAIMLAEALAGQSVVFDDHPSEGKIALKSSHRGLLKVDVKALRDFNLIPDVTCSSRHNNSMVNEGDIIAATRAIPLIIDETLIKKAVNVAGDTGGIFSVKKLAQPEIGLIITGNEVYNGLIEDKFAHIIKKKLNFFGCHLKEIIYTPDDMNEIIQRIKGFHEKGMGLILVAGGMSVDPDDVSRMAIAEAGAKSIVYGTPVLPGAMFLYGRLGDIPIMGLPACILYYNATVFDLVLPRILAGEILTRRDLAEMAHGGLCLGCEQCRYPVCPFGK
ncbi:MAG: molybdopterin-binding protein [Thermodesulfobacteriota bacterium]|nr:molybdopterin-binding protein [Thermodesulfobacteriota bacterium]